MNKLKHRFWAFGLILVFWASAFVASGQNYSVNYNSQSIEQIIRDLRDKTHYEFVYQKQVTIGQPLMSLKAENVSLEVLLNMIFIEHFGLEYEVVDKSIILRKADHRKPVTLRGRVMDHQREPLAGATVYVRETRRGSVADENGDFEIQIVRGQTLSISYLGFETREMKYTGFNDVEILLNYDAKNTLEDVVVTGIFQKAKESYTGSVSTISSDQIELYAGQNLLQTLKNIDASISFGVDNLAGSNPNRLPQLNIRGNSSLPTSVEEYNEGNKNNPNSPLIILDGFEISLTKLMDYNDEEIQSINILKDASATAIYGSRGANGVIVVTTKKPEAGKLKINLEAGTTIEIPDLSSYHLLNAAEKLEVERRAGLYDYPATMSGNELLYREAYNNRLRDVLSGTDTDWLSVPLRNGVGQSYKLRLEGGSKEFRWATSLSYKDVEGAMKGSTRKTFNGTITLMYQLGKVLFRNYTSVGYNRSKESNYGDYSNYVNQQPYNAPYDHEGHLVRFFPAFIKNYSKPQNPLYDASLNSFDKTGYQEVSDQFAIEWNILKELNMRAQFGISRNENTSDYFLPAEHSYFTVDNVDEYSTDEGILRRGLYRYGNSTSIDLNAEVTLYYNKLLADKHSLYAGIDWSLITNQTDAFNVALEGFTNDDMANIANARQYAENEMPSGANYKTHQFGLTGNINYTYDNRYYLDLSYRVDGSSAYGANKKYAPFWSVGTGWNLHQEKWLRNHRVISTLRLKASYGETGAATGASTTDAYTTYRYVTDNRYMSWLGAQLTGWGNPNLTWQKTKETNVGLEFSLWRNRIKGSLDWYTKRTSNLLSSMNLPLSMGFASYMANVGEVKNLGYEAMLQGYVVRSQSQRLNVMLTAQLVYNKNEITKLSEAIKAQNEAYLQQAEANDGSSLDIQNLFYEGNPQNAIYAVRSLGIDPSTGREIYLDRNGNISDTWNAADKVCLGSADPLYRGNASALVQWRDWQLNVAFYYYWGGKSYNSTLRDRVEVSKNALTTRNVDERVLTSRWYKEGDVVFFKALSNETTRATSRYVMDNNVLELSSVTLQYKLHNDWLQKHCRLQTIIFGITTNDLAHWGSIRMERGTSYPYARNLQGSVKLLF